jgi:phosphate transport system permease protein
VTTLAPPPPSPPSPPTQLPPTPRVPRRIGTPLRPRDFGWAEAGVLVASLVSSLALVWVIFYQLSLLSGAFGFLLCWYGCFLGLYWLVTTQTVDKMTATDRVVSAVVVTAALLAFGVVLFIIFWVLWKGVPHLSAHIFTKDQSHFTPSDPNILSKIGVAHEIVGTAEQVGIAAVIGVPVAVITAVFLNEVQGRGTRMVRTVVTAMSGLPSIVAGLFIYSIFVERHLLNHSGFLASLALFILLLPSVTRTTEEVLRIVPGGLREASLALGSSEFRTVWSVVLPTARSGMITASLLGVAIAIGETAPLLFTSFGSSIMNKNPFHGAQGSLPLGIYDNLRYAQNVLHELAFATASILLGLVLILFVLARILGRQRSKTGAWRARLSSITSRSEGKGRRARTPAHLATSSSHRNGDPISIADHRRRLEP